jgi:hypothetical protein
LPSGERRDGRLSEWAMERPEMEGQRCCRMV